MVSACSTTSQRPNSSSFDLGLVCQDLKAKNLLKRNEDYDNDGIVNAKELERTGTDPCNADTDGDFLRDGFELEMEEKGILKRNKKWGNAALDQDSDDDGILDSQEDYGSKTLFDLQPGN